MSSAHPSGTAVLQAIAYIRNDFPTKFGLPRQSGLIDTLEADIVFEPAYRNPSALRGLEGFSHVSQTENHHQVLKIDLCLKILFGGGGLLMLGQVFKYLPVHSPIQLRVHKHVSNS